LRIPLVVVGSGPDLRDSLGVVHQSELIAMFKWIKSLRRRGEVDSGGEEGAPERDSGDEEYETHEEEEREAAPDGSTRIKTDNL
jgi:hypothetical protein